MPAPAPPAFDVHATPKGYTLISNARKHGRLDAEMLLGSPLSLSRFTEPRLAPAVAIVLRGDLEPNAQSDAAYLAIGAMFLAVEFLDDDRGGYLVDERPLEVSIDAVLSLSLDGELRSQRPLAAFGDLGAQLAWLAGETGGLRAGEFVCLGSAASELGARPGTVELCGPRGSNLISEDRGIVGELRAPAPTSVETIARRLFDAAERRKPIQPLTETEQLDSQEEAYAIQRRLTGLRLERGDTVIGHKIGLTSRAMQEQLSVTESDYGSLWSSRYFPALRRRAEMPADRFLQPRLEGELAFLIGEPLHGGHITAQEVMVATEAIAVAVEVIDSRIEDWRIALPDTIADNASYGALTLGPWSRRLRDADLRTLGMVIHHNRVAVLEGLGAAALGHPARCVAWLANKLASFGVSLETGDIVLSGALGRSIPAQRGDVFVVETYGQPPLTTVFA